MTARPPDTHRSRGAGIVTMYGIKNCDTIKKARAWLASRGVEVEFHDYKTAGIDRARLERWCREWGWERLLNRAGTTFRRLPENEKTGLDERSALRLMLAHPSSIKRPVLEIDGRVIVGFAPEVYEQLARVSRPGKPAARTAKPQRAD